MKLKTNILPVCGVIAAASLAMTSCGEKKPDAPASATPSTTSTTPAAPSTPAAAAAPAAPSVPTGDLVDITPEYPKPMFIGTPVPTGDIKNLEKPDPEAVKARLTLKVPKGTENVAKGKKVSSSDALPIIGSLDLVTDGDADGSDGCYVELAPQHQWIQIDLGANYDIWKILVWHFHKQTAVYFDVNVQVSDDPEFKKGVTSLYNSDDDDSSKLGKGSDPAYVETNHGRLIEGKGTKGRYVRLYSNGNTANEMNHYIEVQVYGTPAK
ncbi:hypothetical protein AYO49_05845 [Verrucomicrobiaceae bacterium SCGC AG-212-N21]|nr:hypothetical protein AYO49_05845 [Verrucomicrobiaceae bacterium SCGC AG-212-N21]